MCEADRHDIGPSRVPRTVNETDLQPLLAFKTGKQEGGFDVGIERALQLILASPKFVFRLERDPANLKPGAVYKVATSIWHRGCRFSLEQHPRRGTAG